MIAKLFPGQVKLEGLSEDTQCYLNRLAKRAYVVSHFLMKARS
jgi:hypothetical protein